MQNQFDRIMRKQERIKARRNNQELWAGQAESGVRFKGVASFSLQIFIEMMANSSGKYFLAKLSSSSSDSLIDRFVVL